MIEQVCWGRCAEFAHFARSGQLGDGVHAVFDEDRRGLLEGEEGPGFWVALELGVGCEGED